MLRTASMGIGKSGAGHRSNQQRSFCCAAVQGPTNKAWLSSYYLTLSKSQGAVQSGRI